MFHTGSSLHSLPGTASNTLAKHNKPEDFPSTKPNSPIVLWKENIPCTCTDKIVCSPHHHKVCHLFRSLSLIPLPNADASEFEWPWASHCLLPLHTQASVPLALCLSLWNSRMCSLQSPEQSIWGKEYCLSNSRSSHCSQNSYKSILNSLIVMHCSAGWTGWYLEQTHLKSVTVSVSRWKLGKSLNSRYILKKVTITTCHLKVIFENYYFLKWEKWSDLGWNVRSASTRSGD